MSRRWRRVREAQAQANYVARGPPTPRSVRDKRTKRVFQSRAAAPIPRADESPEAVLRRGRGNALADLIRYVIDNDGDAAEPNSRVTPEALAKREWDFALAALSPGPSPAMQTNASTTKEERGMLAHSVTGMQTFPRHFDA